VREGFHEWFQIREGVGRVGRFDNGNRQVLITESSVSGCYHYRFTLEPENCFSTESFEGTSDIGSKEGLNVSLLHESTGPELEVHQGSSCLAVDVRDNFYLLTKGIAEGVKYEFIPVVVV